MPPLGWKVTLKQETESIITERTTTTKNAVQLSGQEIGILANQTLTSCCTSRTVG